MGRDPLALDLQKGDASLNDNDRSPIGVDGLRSSFDPSGSTWVLSINEVGEHPCEVVNSTQVKPGEWRFDIRTTGAFAGPAVPAGSLDGATLLDYGSHWLEVRATQGDRIVANGIHFPLVMRKGNGASPIPRSPAGLWVGEGPPPASIPGSQPGDQYFDSLTGDLYQLTP